MTETEELLSCFKYDHLPPHLQPLSKPFHDAAHQIMAELEGVDSYQINVGLQKLIEAKDCMVRAALRKS